MKKIFNKTTFIIIIMSLGIVVGVSARVIYHANEMTYIPNDSSLGVSTMDVALNSLHSIKQELNNIKSLGDATAADLAKDKTAVVKGELITGTQVDATVGVYNLGTSTSFNVKDYIANNNIPGVDYTKLTANNFLIKGVSSSKSSAGNKRIANYNTVAVAAINGMAKSYNASTGVLSCYVSATGGIGTNSSSDFSYSAGTTASVNAYLVIY